MLELADTYVDPFSKISSYRYFSTLVYLLKISRGSIVYLQSGKGSDRTLLVIRPEMPKMPKMTLFNGVLYSYNMILVHVHTEYYHSTHITDYNFKFII